MATFRSSKFLSRLIAFARVDAILSVHSGLEGFLKFFQAVRSAPVVVRW